MAAARAERMQSLKRIYSLPRWRLTRWLADGGPGVPEDVRVALIGNLFGNLPVFVGGVILWPWRLRSLCANRPCRSSSGSPWKSCSAPSG
jgi:hypothetical protein